MSSSTTPPALKPLYTRELLNDIEASLANNGKYIELKNTDGKTFRSENLHRGVRTGDVAPGRKERRNIVMFHDDRNLKRLQAQGKADQFFPVFNASTLFQGATKTKEEVRATFQGIARAFEASAEAVAITELIRTHLDGCAVDKVIAFGLGRISNIGPGPLSSFYEHAAARVVWKAVQEVSSAPKVALLVQNPLYTDVCKKVLQESDFDIIEGFGAKGFSLTDDNTVVLGHRPSFPLRQIVADLARPALISMRAQTTGDRPTQFQELPDPRADVDSARSREMLKGYRGISFPITRQKAFWENTWYVKILTANQSE
ncbi:hypothetical protein CHU98_g5165 [Xylaria longipes]|nr:hypothetical protein CHU98_g5165 [Xylaria longipes]